MVCFMKQIYDMILVRHGLMVVGDPIGGKSSAIRCLARALNNLHDKQLMEEYPVSSDRENPSKILTDKVVYLVVCRVCTPAIVGLSLLR